MIRGPDGRIARIRYVLPRHKASLVAESKRHGARVALFGRKINAAEHQLEFIRFLRGPVNGA